MFKTRFEHFSLPRYFIRNKLPASLIFLVMCINDNFLFAQLQGVKDDLGRKEREYASLQLQAETLKRQHEETLHHVTVLKEQLAAKEKQTTMLQADVSDVSFRHDCLPCFVGIKMDFTIGVHTSSPLRCPFQVTP